MEHYTLGEDESRPLEAELQHQPITEVEHSDFAMYGYGPSPVQTDKAQRESAANQRIEALKILDADNFKLGDLNPLIHAPDLMRKESTDAVIYTIQKKIEQYEGESPKVLESAVVLDPESGKSGLRFIARFEVPQVSKEQMELLEQLVRDTYGISVRTRTDSKGNKIHTENYPPIQPGEEYSHKTGGWYMGPYGLPTSSLHQGLFVFKDLGKIDDSTYFNEGEEEARKHIVEIRESSQYQTDLVTMVTQVATILSKGELPSRGQLLYESYYDLIRLGLKKVDEDSIYGMEGAMDMIKRELITPLASPDISGAIGQEPQSVLMIGVPGTGKTLIAERLLQEETGLFILPIDPFELQKELHLPKEKQYLLPRIAEIGRITGKKVILHVDDIENMVNEGADTNSTLLNLMAGVQESGFFIIASTNYPEKINQSLIQPQRFSVLLHCGLQDESARYEILKIHADLESRKLGMPLFKSDEIRDEILREVASHTHGFTPRYLANIATVAKSHLVSRVSKAQGRMIGLQEAELEGHMFDVDDWENGLAEVSSKYDSASVTKRNDELSRIVKKHGLALGFRAENAGSKKGIFSKGLFDRIAEAEARLQPGTAAAQSMVESAEM